MSGYIIDESKPNENTINKERFKKAYEYAKLMLEEYKCIQTGMFGAISIQHDIDLYEKGDRSDALLESMEGIQ